jgi:hypothetical protein
MAKGPTERQLRALRAIADLEEGRRAVLNVADAEECENLGWAEAQPGGGYALTDAGREVLAAYEG